MDKTKTQKNKFVGIRMGLDEMIKRKEDNHDSPEVLPRMTSWEILLNYATFTNCKKTEERLERDLKKSLNICARLQKLAITLSIKFHFPQIGKLGKP
jgi:hypothetical protein